MHIIQLGHTAQPCLGGGLHETCFMLDDSVLTVVGAGDVLDGQGIHLRCICGKPGPAFKITALWLPTKDQVQF